MIREKPETIQTAKIERGMIDIAEDFYKWLKDMEEKYEKYGWDKDEIQSLIKQFLI